MPFGEGKLFVRVSQHFPVLGSAFTVLVLRLDLLWLRLNARPVLSFLKTVRPYEITRRYLEDPKPVDPG